MEGKKDAINKQEVRKEKEESKERKAIDKY